MTHAEAIEQSRRVLHYSPECRHELTELGPDEHFEMCVLWVCTGCCEYLSIDPCGVIRDKGPAGIIPAAFRICLEARNDPT